MVDAWRVADEYWSAVFEVTDGTEVWADGIHPTFVDDPRAGVYVMTVRESVRVRAPVIRRAEVEAVTRSIAVDTALDPALWQEALAACAPLVRGPASHLLADGDARFAGRAEHISAAEAEAFAVSSSAAEVEESGIADRDVDLFGVRVGRELAAVARLGDWAGARTDVGVLTAPAFRERGLAGQVAGAALASAVETSGFARWRTRDDNTASMALARRLGLVFYGRNLGIRLGETPTA